MKLLVCAIAVLVAMATQPCTGARSGFNFGSLIPKPSRISCSSVLVKLNPSAFPHCCQVGPYQFSGIEDTSSCPSGRQYVLTRKTCPGQPGTKKVCEPTIQEKAENLAETLKLGDNSANVPKINNFKRVLSKRVNTTAVHRGRRALTVPCPSNQAQKAVCQDILSQSCPTSTGKRSVEAFEEERTLLADFVQAQEHSYTNKNTRTKRQPLPSTQRNVIFAVDSSGSIGSTTFNTVLDILANFSSLFCGDASIGMMTFSRTIDLEFCPTCLRNLDEVTYRSEVASKIRSARYHRSATNTGETVKCLSEEILPSPDCRDLSKPTQVVFFTDGRANGRCKVPPALADLSARYPTLETYAIGMGNILQSGVTELLSNTFDPNNIFNVQNITELRDLLQAIKDLIYGGSLDCSPVTFG